MADACKVKAPAQNIKKTPEGSGKKRRKHKKSADSSGDGAPSTKPVQTNPSQVPTSLSQTGTEGASGGNSGGQINSPSAKKTTKQENNTVTFGESVEKLMSNPTDKDRKYDVPETNIQCLDIKDSKHDKQSGKEEVGVGEELLEVLVLEGLSIKQKSKVGVGEELLEVLVLEERLLFKQVSEDRKVGELPQKSCPHQTSIARNDNDLSATEVQFGAEKKDTPTTAVTGEQQKGKVHSKTEQTPKTNSEKVSAPIDPQKKETVKASSENKKTADLGAEHRQQAKGVPEKKPDLGSGEQKSKAQLKAERRAVQEAQRAAKDAKKSEPSGASLGGPTNSSSAASAKKEHVGDKLKSSTDVTGGEKNKKKSVGELTNSEKSRKKPAVELSGGDRNKKKPAENVVQQEAETEEQMWTRKENEILRKSLKIDNSIMSLGFQYFHHTIVGANARCLALLATLKEVIKKYRTPDEKELSRDLEKNCLNPCISYINNCRPISTSMGNAIRHLKYHINHIPSDMEDETAIKKLLEEIDNFIEVHIIKAAEGVAHNAISKIDDGDVILVYAASSLIGQVLKKAFRAGKKFRVIVVEGRPRNEGKAMLKNLVRCGIPCSYIYIGSASHAMSETTKVFLGAAAMFAIGDMYSRSGNSMIAALAKANNIPVLVCCETYKFTDKVQLHSADSNRHTRGKDLVSIGHKTPILADWEEIGLRLLNLMYDVTGSEYITAVVTELGMLPCTSVPVVLRRQEDLY